MKKLFIVFVALLVFTSCSRTPGEHPAPLASETVTAFLGLIQEGNYEEATALATDDPFSGLEPEYRVIFQNLSYDISFESIVDDLYATVSLTISTIDFTAIMDDVMTEAFYWVFMEISDRELLAKIETLLLEKLSEEDAPTISTDLDIHLELYENEWKIIVDEALTNALTGGLVSFADYVSSW